MPGDPTGEDAGIGLRRQYDRLMLHLQTIDNKTGDALMHALIDTHRQWRACHAHKPPTATECVDGARQLVQQARHFLEGSPGAAYGLCLLAMHLEALARPGRDAAQVSQETRQLIEDAYVEWREAQADRPR